MFYIHDISDLLGYSYLIEFTYHDLEIETYRELYVYDNCSKKFINTLNIPIDILSHSHIKNLYSYITHKYDGEFLDDHYDIVEKLGYDEWANAYTSSMSMFKDINS